MKSFFSSRRIYIILFLVLAVALAACERQVRDDETPDASQTTPASNPPAVPTTDPALVPTTDPALVPTTDPALVPTTDPAAQPTPGADAGVQVTPPAAGATTYVVVAGDTLFSIATAYGITLEELAAANNLDPNGLLTPGQTLTIPAADTTTVPPTVDTPETTADGEQVHIVQAGENLFRIGLRYGCTVNELAAYNNIANPDRISVGQRILIPPSCGG